MSDQDKEQKAAATPHGDQKKRTVFILYIPGGAMLAVGPAVLMKHIEDLSEMRITDLFQVFDLVSSGAITGSGLNVRDEQNPALPKHKADKSFELYCKHGPEIFPEMPGRMTKMWAANALNMFDDYVDPAAADELAIDDIREICAELRAIAPWEYRESVKRLEDIATSRWLTKRTRQEALSICGELGNISEEIDHHTDKIGELVFCRTLTGSLSMVFRKSAIGVSHLIKKHYANNYLLDPSVPREIYRNILGPDTRIGDTVRSVYISAFDVKKGRAQTFYSRKADFFSLDPNTPTETTEGNPKLYDVVMASTANQFMFPTHQMEDGRLFSDKAPVHTPLTCIQDVFDHKPEDANVKLVIFGTGKYITKKKDLDGDTIRERYMKYGVAGNLLKGRELAELEDYVMSTMRDVVRSRIGSENIIEISPRLSPHTYAELQSFPSKDITNASRENIERIANRMQEVIVKQDEAIRNLVQELIDNAHATGVMDDDKYERVSKKLGVRTPEEYLRRNQQDLSETVDRNVPPSPKGIKKMFRDVTRFLGLTPRPPKGPTPGGPS